MKTEARSVKIFYSYAHRDKEFKDELAKHLGRSYISVWHDREILAGANWAKEIDQNLQRADLILLLISADFIASDYCYGVEMKRALEMHAAGEATVISIILRPVYWKDVPFSHLQVLPTGGKPVTSWIDRDEAFVDIASGVRRAIDIILKRQYMADAQLYEESGNYEEALTAYDQALRIVPNDPQLYEKRGDILFLLKRSDEALDTYTQALTLLPNQSSLYKKSGDTLVALGQFNEAQETYEKAISLSPGNAEIYLKQGDAFFIATKYEQALDSYNKALALDSDDVRIFLSIGRTYSTLGQYEKALEIYTNAVNKGLRDKQLYVDMGDTFFSLNQYEKALAAYDEAIILNSDSAKPWRNKGVVLVKIGNVEEAKNVYEQAINRDPNNAFLYKEYGDILFKLGDLIAARTAYDDAIRLKPDFNQAYAGQAKVFDALAEQSRDRFKQLASEFYRRADEAKEKSERGE